MKNEILDGVKEVLREIFQRNYTDFNQQITGDMAFQEDMGLDSIDLAVLQIELEDRWNIRFDPLEDDFSRIFYSVRSLCEFLELRIGENNGR